jgi:hypothetical protein
MDPPAKKEEQPVDFERLAEIFAPPGTPSIKGKPWVVVETGPVNSVPWLSNRHGWLIENGAKEILLLDWDGASHNFRKPDAGEIRPRIKEEKDGGKLWSDLQNADYSVAWKVHEKDYGAKSKKFLTDGLPKDTEEKNIFGSVDQRFGLADHVVESVRYAHYAHQFGQKDHAAELYAHAGRAYKEYTSRYGPSLDKKVALPDFVAERIASGYRNGAIYSGHGGTPRKELLKQWEKVAIIPHHPYRNEARGMVKHYQSLLDEDARWVEPDEKALAKLTTDQKVAYWLYHLRDLDIGQYSDPGHCDVLERFAFGFRGADKKPNAAVELKKLGMAAVPALIEHLDDARPTRCKGHWRRFWPDGHYLLRYGDCCQQIFVAITRHTLPGEAGKERKQKAERWWQDYQKKGEKQMLIEGTAVGDGDSAAHAEELAKKYPEVALAPIIEGARASKEARIRAWLISTADKLKDEKVVAFLREELDGPHMHSRVRAGVALAARGDPAGVKALVREWNHLAGKNADRFENSWAIDELIHALTCSGDPAAVCELGARMQQHDVGTRQTIVGELASAETDLGKKPLSRDAVDAIEDVLIRAMEDQEHTH